MATSAGTGNQIIGKAFILHGTVKAVAPDGTVRVLGPNSVIYADERIITESDGSVSIMLDGPPPGQIDIGRMSDVLLNEDVYAGATPEVVTDAAADAERIQEALTSGDQPIELDATAAGGGAGAGGGITLVNFALDGSEGNVTSGAETTGIGLGTVNPLLGIVVEDTVLAVAPEPVPEPIPDHLHLHHLLLLLLRTMSRPQARRMRCWMMKVCLEASRVDWAMWTASRLLLQARCPMTSVMTAPAASPLPQWTARPAKWASRR